MQGRINGKERWFQKSKPKPKERTDLSIFPVIKGRSIKKRCCLSRGSFKKSFVTHLTHFELYPKDKHKGIKGFIKEENHREAGGRAILSYSQLPCIFKSLARPNKAPILLHSYFYSKLWNKISINFFTNVCIGITWKLRCMVTLNLKRPRNFTNHPLTSFSILFEMHK